MIWAAFWVFFFHVLLATLPQVPESLLSHAWSEQILLQLLYCCYWSLGSLPKNVFFFCCPLFSGNLFLRYFLFFVMSLWCPFFSTCWLSSVFHSTKEHSFNSTFILLSWLISFNNEILYVVCKLFVDHDWMKPRKSFFLHKNKCTVLVVKDSYVRGTTKPFHCHFLGFPLIYQKPAI